VRALRRAELLVAVLVVGGCGSSPLSLGDLRSQASRICSASSARLARIPTPASPAQAEAFLGRGIAALHPELSQLQALQPPSDDAAVYRATLTSFSTQLSYLTEAVHDLRSGEDPLIALKTVQREISTVQSQENGGWQALQIPACVSR
jgi:hypothetical protein